MIAPSVFHSALQACGINFVAGVPDSLLKEVCACITQCFPAERHVIAANEGAAIGLAIGHYLASNSPALVYMQNSGLGNVVNPIASLADPQVYGIPMLLMVGWRGEILTNGTQIHDEPQHIKQGQVTIAQLEILDIPYVLIDAQTPDIEKVLKDLVQLALTRQAPVALLVRKQTFSPFKFEGKAETPSLLSREQAIQLLVQNLPENTAIVSTTGMASRELFEYRKVNGTAFDHDFLTVGGMGHASQIATGIAMECPTSKILCIDGDGAMLMHMGSLTVSARQKNLIHVVINNGAHDSVGGQPTLAKDLDLSKIASDCGYGFIAQVATEEALLIQLRLALHANTSVFLEIKCKCGARADLGRPDRTPSTNKHEFMKFLKSL
ncbi:MAG: phosphonopyruvate decarboxylase [Methylotenera sp.]|nr:phosphonopyruvate decarboxylase [Methylotenera sp.]